MRRSVLWTSRAVAPAAALLAALLLAAAPAGAVIVNSLRGFSDTEPGWSGGLGGSLGATGGNTEQSTLTADAHLQFRGGRHVWRLFGKAKRTTSGGQTIARSVLGHLRHNRRLGDSGWHTLSFVQLQENPFQDLELRFLAGAGLRWDLVRREKTHFALGAADMYERERIEGLAGHDTTQRLSMFATTVFDVRDGVTVDALTFYQPRWADFGDWRVFVSASLDVALTGNLSLFSSLDLERDSRPPVGVEQTDWETATGLRLRF